MPRRYVMFEDMFGARVETIALQSLEIGSNVAGSVVDAWAHVLNGDPKFSIPGMPRRLFCVHTAVTLMGVACLRLNVGSRVAWPGDITCWTCERSTWSL
ncbi:hypothetical protein HanXRQr2_Chr05g0231311 [Helianthus annuus]|uniref:Uncharacterized protein n=1 Tax=Helianthus annuus TaxID=4232 RepID=A0A9K3NQ08_HELAN|nr:hypothetical protein HanXRQr2_Chr05g0231311 [Helianthus annuus]